MHNYYNPYKEYLKDERLNNGPIEGMNSRLKDLVKIGHGYKSFTLYRKRVMYVMNKDIKIRR